MELLAEYIQENLVGHHIKGFNHLLSHGLQDIINREPPVHGLRFGAVHVDKPVFVDMNRQTRPMFPNQARKRNETYEGVVSVNIIYNGKETPRVPIGKIPIMLKSSACNLTSENLIVNEECPYDKGGYFIIKGKERVLVSQLRQCFNRVYTFPGKVLDKKKYSFYSEIRSMNDSGLSVLVKAFIDKKRTCFFSLPYIKTILPAGLVFKALGDEIDIDDIVKWIGCKNKNFNNTLIAQFNEYPSAQCAIKEISVRLPECEGDRVDYVISILNNELFYHIGVLTPQKSSMHLAYILKRLLSVATGSLRCDEKHNLTNTRVDASGTLVAFIFNGLFKQFVKNLSNQMNDKIKAGCAFDPIHLIRSINNITYGMVGVFMASNWTTQKSTNVFSREGVSQVLPVKNMPGRLSQLRRLTSPNGVKGKNTTARLLHSSHFGFLCPYETPEGERVGLITNLSLTADVTLPIPSHEIRESRVLDCLEQPFVGTFLILLNGAIAGSCSDAYAFKRRFNEFRDKNLIDPKVALVWQRYSNELHIWSDDGRLVRPLFNVSADNTVSIPKNFKQGLLENSIVFRDQQELEQSVVAIDENALKLNRCDLMEICVSAALMSVTAPTVPFSNHSQSPRIAYQSNMVKQSLGTTFLTSTLSNVRYDTAIHSLNYPQQPITRPEIIKILKFNELPHGILPIVAIMTDGFNQEDSFIINGGSRDRGFADVMEYETITEEERKRGNTDYETICFPKIEYRKHDINYSYLNENGVVKNDKSIYVKAGDAIIGKTHVKMVKNAEGVKESKTVDITVTIKSGEEGYIDSVLDIINSEGVRVIKVKLRRMRRPEIGDKFASSCAQKGTCGMVYPQEDMPFDADGISPDIIINPHAIPSRMTINMLIEQSLNMIGCKTGEYQDATPFEHPDIIREIKEKMIKNGIVDYLGRPAFKRVLYSGKTGKKLPSLVFIGPAYYQRLCHLVAKKWHARVTGAVDAITRVPVGGRAKNGAFRLGPMEIDAILGSGCAYILKTLMYDQSDAYVLPVCSRCGQIPLYATYCRICDEENTVKKVITPYATKLFYQLLMGHGLKLKIRSD